MNPEPAKTEPAFPIWARWMIGILCALGSLPFLFHLVENYRGKKAWEETKIWLEEQGESLEYEPPSLPEVSDEDTTGNSQCCALFSNTKPIPI